MALLPQSPPHINGGPFTANSHPPTSNPPSTSHRSTETQHVHGVIATNPEAYPEMRSAVQTGATNVTSKAPVSDMQRKPQTQQRLYSTSTAGQRSAVTTLSSTEGQHTTGQATLNPRMMRACDVLNASSKTIIFKDLVSASAMRFHDMWQETTVAGIDFENAQIIAKSNEHEALDQVPAGIRPCSTAAERDLYVATHASKVVKDHEAIKIALAAATKQPGWVAKQSARQVHEQAAPVAEQSNSHCSGKSFHPLLLVLHLLAAVL